MRVQAERDRAAAQCRRVTTSRRGRAWNGICVRWALLSPREKVSTGIDLKPGRVALDLTKDIYPLGGVYPIVVI